MEHINYTLTKIDFKVIRALLSIALEREFVQGLEQVATTIAEWRAEKPESARDHYHQVLSDLKDHRKELRFFYDNQSKSIMLSSVSGLLRRGVLTEADLADIKPQLKDNLVWRARD